MAARQQVELLLSAAVGMCVVVLQNDQGFITIPQLFFGQLNAPFQEQVVELCGEEFPDVDGLKKSLHQLAERLKPGSHSPNHFAAADGSSKAFDFWRAFAEGIRQAQDEQFAVLRDDRQADLAHWVGINVQSLAASGLELDGDDLLNAVYCFIAAREVEGAIAQLAQLLDSYEPEDEELLLTLEALAKVAIGQGQASLLSDFAAQRSDDIEPSWAGSTNGKFSALSCSWPIKRVPKRNWRRPKPLKKPTANPFATTSTASPSGK